MMGAEIERREVVQLEGREDDALFQKTSSRSRPAMAGHDRRLRILLSVILAESLSRSWREARRGVLLTRSVSLDINLRWTAHPI
jgi:hypothetical protein